MINLSLASVPRLLWLLSVAPLAQAKTVSAIKIVECGNNSTMDNMVDQKAFLPEGDAARNTAERCPTWSKLTFEDSVTLEVTIPFVKTEANVSFPTNGPPRVLMSINNHFAGNRGVIMDTGSTAITIGKGTWIDSFGGNWTEAETHEKGWKYLSSSQLLYRGYWVPTTLEFHRKVNDTLENLLGSWVPVLVYDTVFVCPDFAKEGPDCVDPNNTPPSNLQGLYMGVGFGREADGMAMCTPDKNPLLNVKTAFGLPVDLDRGNRTYANGFIVRKDSLTWGLTEANTNGFRCTKLDMQPAAKDPRDWAMANVTINVNNKSFRAGNILADTGVTQMYLSSPDVPVPIPNAYTINIHMPDRIGSMGKYVVTALRDGSNNSANSSVPGTAPMRVGAKNTDSANNPGQAADVANRVFVNTGSRFWNGWETVFDAVGGHWGIKSIQ